MHKIQIKDFKRIYRNYNGFETSMDVKMAKEDCLTIMYEDGPNVPDVARIEAILRNDYKVVPNKDVISVLNYVTGKYNGIGF